MSNLSPGLHSASLNGVELSYSVSGRGPLLFAVSSGWGVGSGYLAKGLAPLTTHFTLVSITTRGSGGSSRPADESAMGSEAMADDIDHLRRYLGLDAIDLFGHSNGGAIAISYAARYPQACRKLILADSQLIGFSDHEATMAVLGKRAGDPRFAAALEQLSGIASLAFEDAAITEFLLATFPLYFHDPEANMQKTLETFELPIASWATEKQRISDSQPSAAQIHLLSHVEADTLVLVGQDDFQCPVPTSERIAADIAKSTLIVLDDCGHMPWAEQPQRFFSEIAHFLRQQERQ